MWHFVAALAGWGMALTVGRFGGHEACYRYVQRRSSEAAKGLDELAATLVTFRGWACQRS